MNAALKKWLSRFTASVMVVLFGTNMVITPLSLAQMVPYLPEAGIMVSMTPKFDPMVVKGIKLYPDDPFKFDFIVDTGDMNLSRSQIKDQGQKLASYFLASLTTPEKQMWVNLSPYEKSRIVPPAFGDTEMGKELLSQDYMLKQIMATALYPESQLGKEFWQKIYAQAQRQFGTTAVPVNTFNKVWIVPNEAVVYENARLNTVFVVKSSLKVMLEQDYLAANKHKAMEEYGMTEDSLQKIIQSNAIGTMGSRIIKQVVIPALEKEVNEGKNFAGLRQVYQSLILAAWYKKNLRDNVLAQGYINRNKTLGIDTQDKEIIAKIYRQYLRAYRKGVYNYIKEDIDPATQQIVPRKYFSGGANMAMIISALSPANAAQISAFKQRTWGAVIAGGVFSLMIGLSAIGGGAQAATIQGHQGASSASPMKVLIALAENHQLHVEHKIGSSYGPAIDIRADQINSFSLHQLRGGDKVIFGAVEQDVRPGDGLGSTLVNAGAVHPGLLASLNSEAPKGPTSGPTSTETTASTTAQPAPALNEPINLQGTINDSPNVLNANAVPRIHHFANGGVAFNIDKPAASTIQSAPPAPIILHPPQRLMALAPQPQTPPQVVHLTAGGNYTKVIAGNTFNFSNLLGQSNLPPQGHASTSVSYTTEQSTSSPVSVTDVWQMNQVHVVKLVSSDPKRLERLPSSVHVFDVHNGNRVVGHEYVFPPTVFQNYLQLHPEVGRLLEQKHFSIDGHPIESGPAPSITAGGAPGGPPEGHENVLATNLNNRSLSIYASAAVPMVSPLNGATGLPAAIPVVHTGNLFGVQSPSAYLQVKYSQKLGPLGIEQHFRQTGPGFGQGAPFSQAMTTPIDRASTSNPVVNINGGIDLEKLFLSSKGSGVRTAFSDPRMLKILLEAKGLYPEVESIEQVTVPMFSMLLGFNLPANDNLQAAANDNSPRNGSSKEPVSKSTLPQPAFIRSTDSM